MKIEIEKSEYDRLKSREEKLIAYYGWFVDKENDLATVEDIVNKNIELEGRIRFLEQCLDNKEKVNKSMREELEWYHGFDNYLTNHGFDMKKLKENIKNQN